MTQSDTLFEDAQRYIPGGVNSPVRAFRGVGGNPVFFEKGQGPYLFDADGKRYIDYIGSWGPMILGHNDPRVHSALARSTGGRRGLRRTHCGGNRHGAQDLRAGALHRDGAHGELRHRSHHERHPPGPRLYRTRQDRQVRGLLSRPCRFPAGQGRLRRAHTGRAELPRGARKRCRAHTDPGLQRSRRGRRHCSPNSATILLPSSSSPLPAT